MTKTKNRGLKKCPKCKSARFYWYESSSYFFEWQKCEECEYRTESRVIPLERR